RSSTARRAERFAWMSPRIPYFIPSRPLRKSRREAKRAATRLGTRQRVSPGARRRSESILRIDSKGIRAGGLPGRRARPGSIRNVERDEALAKRAKPQQGPFFNGLREVPGGSGDRPAPLVLP